MVDDSNKDYVEYKKHYGDPKTESEPAQQTEEEVPTEERRPFFQLINKHSEIWHQDKQISLLPYDLVGELAGETVCELLLNSQKVYAKKNMESKFERLMSTLKDNQNNKLSLVDVQKIMAAINMVDTAENQSSALWIGPDIVNVTGVTNSVLRSTKNIADVVADHYRQFKQSFPYEVIQREDSFMLSLFEQLCSDSKSAVDIHMLKGDPQVLKLQSSVDQKTIIDQNFDKIGFAAIKNKNISYVIDKPVVIIGSSKKLVKTFDWEVDVDLFPDPYVSKQHAVILFNFQSEKFEIKCLSTTNPIKVKDRLLSNKDDPKPLDENCFIRIGGQTLWFTIMNEEDINNDDIDEN
jgi:FHA domain